MTSRISPGPILVLAICIALTIVSMLEAGPVGTWGDSISQVAASLHLAFFDSGIVSADSGAPPAAGAPTVGAPGQGVAPITPPALTPTKAPAQAPPIAASDPPISLVESAATTMAEAVPLSADAGDDRAAYRELRAAGRTSSSGSASTTTIDPIPVYSASDFLGGYLNNLTSAIPVQGKPWDNGSTNIPQLQQPGEGTSYWDYWSESEPWTSANHQWRDDQGNWHLYSTETIQGASGKTDTAYVLVDRPGPGVMDKLWFTQDCVQSFLGVLTQSNLFFTLDPPQVTDWGNLDKLGNLRIEVDDQIVYDGPIELWFSGNAQHLTPTLRNILVWRYGQFGSDGNIIPIPYQKHIKVSVYGGQGKPKWFMATGLTLPSGTLVQPYTGPDDLPIAQMDKLANNVVNPENYINSFPGRANQELSPQAGSPADVTLGGSGTVGAIEFKVSKSYDLSHLWLHVSYGGVVGIDLPFVAFFSEPDRLSLHHSTPIGVIASNDSYLFYSNFPLPYQNGIQIEVSSDSSSPIPMTMSYATMGPSSNTQLRVTYDPNVKLKMYGPDMHVDVQGSGKLVGLVLATKDQQFDSIPTIKSKDTGQEDNAKKAWPMGYLEGNLTLTDGAGNSRYYSGQEDWAEGGYYFNSGYTAPRGGSNRPFGGILAYQGGKDGYATLFRYFNDLSAFPFQNGLHLAFGHGTWQNNFPVTYSAIAFYYSQVPGLVASTLPASSYLDVTTPAADASKP